VTSLDLDERHQVAPSSYQIDIVVPQPEAMGFDVPAASREIGQSNPFSPKASELMQVYPLGSGSESANAWHGERICSARRSGGIPAVRHRTKS
jgi:hypothetical protein